MIDFMKAKKTDFKKLPRIDELKVTEREFDSLIIIPERYKHDSGYLCMSVVGCKGSKAVCIMGGGSDVIHFDGIGGYGNWCKGVGSKIPDKIPPKAWSIDCIPCGYLRIFAYGNISIGSCFSSFEIYADRPTEKGGAE
jgi:hypothetical protein